MTTPPQLLPFPESWRHALVVVAHPDDPEYGMAAVSRVDFLGFPDSAIQDTAELRAAISRALEDRRPDVGLTLIE